MERPDLEEDMWYVATMDLIGMRYTPPYNHGLIRVDDRGYIYGQYPLEDYGGYILSKSPLPYDLKKLSNLFEVIQDE